MIDLGSVIGIVLLVALAVLLLSGATPFSGMVNRVYDRQMRRSVDDHERKRDALRDAINQPIPPDPRPKRPVA